MGKKSRKKKKQEKVSDGSTGNVNGGGSNNNNNHNSIPTMEETVAATTTTTTMVLTQEDLEHLNNKCKLKGYPRSNYFVVGYRALKADTYDLAIDAFTRGAEKDGCVGCMSFLVFLQSESNNIHLLLPWALECSIRGHTNCISQLIANCYNKSKPEPAPALSSYWMKMTNELGDTIITEEKRKELKKQNANICCVCYKIDTVEKTFEKCGICKYYSYCEKNCQTYHWKEQNHMAECRHLKILHTFCKPHHVREIQEAIISGVDPKEIPRLQNLRTALGLNRPEEEYEELLLLLGDDSNIQDRYNYLTARKDGTVHIGSTPEAI